MTDSEAHDLKARGKELAVALLTTRISSGGPSREELDLIREIIEEPELAIPVTGLLMSLATDHVHAGAAILRTTPEDFLQNVALALHAD